MCRALIKEYIADKTETILVKWAKVEERVQSSLVSRLKTGTEEG